MLLFLSPDDTRKAPEGYRKISNNIIMDSYLKMDIDNNFRISKNEWMFSMIKLLEKDLELLEKQGPDSVMSAIQDLSDEFDRYDVNGNKFLDYEEYKAIISNNFYISE